MNTFFISFMVTIVICSMVIGLAYIFVYQHSLDREQDLQLAKLKICYNYKPSEDSLSYRETYCPIVEKQVLESKEFQR